MPKKIDLTGKRFGMLVVVKDSGVRRNGRLLWECKCDCGNTSYPHGISLRNGDTKSCGCNGRKKFLKYGEKHNFKTEPNRQETGINYNRKENWKEDTMLCSLQDRKMMSNNRTGVNGVSWCSTYQKFVATIRFQKKLIMLGRYKTLGDATRVRKEAEKKYFTPILEKYGRLKDDRDGA